MTLGTLKTVIAILNVNVTGKKDKDMCVHQRDKNNSINKNN